MREDDFRKVLCAALLFLAGLSGVCTQSQSPKSDCRSKATAVIANARKIVAPDGIERLEKVKIGGIEQFVSMRGMDRSNPVLLVIHGGPGYVSIPMSWWFSRGWEEYFTVVQWDQRGAGETFLLNNPTSVAPTLTRDQMLRDAEEMVQWVRRDLGKQKIFVLGHSWGSFLGLEIALHHPEWLYAYIGVGQFIDGPETERRGWQFAMDRARQAENAKAIGELEAIAPDPPLRGSAPIENVYVERKWVGFFGGVMAYRHDNSADSGLAELSPDYSDEEIGKIWEGNQFSTPYLLPGLLELNLSSIHKLAVPLILFEGRHDWNVNAEVAAAWFETVQAPKKHLVWFENSGHMPMTEEPGKFLVSLVQYALPMANRDSQ